MKQNYHKNNSYIYSNFRGCNLSWGAYSGSIMPYRRGHSDSLNPLAYTRTYLPVMPGMCSLELTMIQAYIFYYTGKK